MKTRENLPRLFILTALCLAIGLVYMGRLLYLQVSGQDYYRMSQRAVRPLRWVQASSLVGRW